jgi:ribosomal protein uL22
MAYGFQPQNDHRTVRARLTGVNASYKDLCEVCRNVRGKDTEWALEFLEGAALGENCIYFARNNKGKGHRKELGGKKGGWPVKSAKMVLNVVQSANANAQKMGLGATTIVHIAANKQDSYPRMSPKGKRIRQNYETAFIEVVLAEKMERAEAEKLAADKKAKEDSEKKAREEKEAKEKAEKEKMAAQSKANSPAEGAEKKAEAPADKAAEKTAADKESAPKLDRNQKPLPSARDTAAHSRKIV